MEETRKQVKKVPNPTGKGGFQERPQDRASGAWKQEDSIGFQYRKMIRMTTEELNAYIADRSSLTIAQQLVYDNILNAIGRKDKETGAIIPGDLSRLKEVTDRSEGKAPQSIDLTTNGESIGRATEEQRMAELKDMFSKHMKEIKKGSAKK